MEPTLHKVGLPPAESLIMKVEELHADLLVVGNKGMRGARRILGSVPNSVAHGAHCSVATIDTSDQPGARRTTTAYVRTTASPHARRYRGATIRGLSRGTMESGGSGR